MGQETCEGQGPPLPLNFGMAREAARAPQMTQTEPQKATEAVKMVEERMCWLQQDDK